MTVYRFAGVGAIENNLKRITCFVVAAVLLFTWIMFDASSLCLA